MEAFDSHWSTIVPCPSVSINALSRECQMVRAHANLFLAALSNWINLGDNLGEEKKGKISARSRVARVAMSNCGPAGPAYMRHLPHVEGSVLCIHIGEQKIRYGHA